MSRRLGGIGASSVAFAERGSAAFLRSLAVIMRSLRLDSKFVQALVIRERHSALTNARASISPGGMSSCLRQFLIESLNRFLGDPVDTSPGRAFHTVGGRRELSILMVCPVHRSWAFTIMASILTRPVLSRISRLETLSCQLIPMIFRSDRIWKRSSCFNCLLYSVHDSQLYRGLVGSLTFPCFNTRERRRSRDWLAVLILAKISLSRDQSGDMMLPRYLKWSTVFSSVPSMVMVGRGAVEPGAC